MAAKAKFSIRAIMGDCELAVRRSRVDVMEREEKLTTRVDRPESTCHLIANAVDDLVIPRATVGALMLSRGDVKGWDGIHRAWMYRAYYLLVGAQRTTDLMGAVEISGAAYALGYALGTGRDTFARWWGQRVYEHVVDGTSLFRPISWQVGTFTERFLLHIFCLWQGLPREFGSHVVQDVGPYAAVFDQWNHPTALGNVISDLSDFHCRHVDDDNIFAFAMIPEQFIPYEIWALQRVRRDLGLETPRVDHPLLTTVFSTPPTEIPPVVDYEFERALDRCERKIPALRMLRSELAETA